jgi:hypothetical protein
MKPEHHTTERLPGVCMDPRTRYAGPGTFQRALTLAPLTDKRIEHYTRLGYYSRRRQHFTERPGGRLVYSV